LDDLKTAEKALHSSWQNKHIGLTFEPALRVAREESKGEEEKERGIFLSFFLIFFLSPWSA